MTSERCLWRGESLRTSLQVLVNPHGITEMFYWCFNIFIQFPNHLHLATRSQRWTSSAQIFISEMVYKSLVLPIFTISLITLFSVPPLRDVYYRECRDGLYSTSTFLLSYSIHIIPFQVVSTFIFSMIVYWLVYIVVNQWRTTPRKVYDLSKFSFPRNRISALILYYSYAIKMYFSNIIVYWYSLFQFFLYLFSSIKLINIMDV